MLDMREERQLQDIELSLLRDIAADFKKAEEKSQLEIAELNLKIVLLNEEKQA